MSETTGKTQTNARQWAWEQVHNVTSTNSDTIASQTRKRQAMFREDAQKQKQYLFYKAAELEGETQLFIDLYIERLQMFLQIHKAKNDVSIKYYDELLRCINKRLQDLWAAGKEWEGRIIKLTNLRNQIKRRATDGKFNRTYYKFIEEITKELRYE